MNHQTTLMGTQPDIRIYSIGYGGRSFIQLIRELSTHEISKIVDVRTIPHTKWFGKRMLKEKLGSNYVGMPELGGKGYTRDPGHNRARYMEKEADKNTKQAPSGMIQAPQPLYRLSLITI